MGRLVAHHDLGPDRLEVSEDAGLTNTWAGDCGVSPSTVAETAAMLA